jgi:hypothetical protein
MEIEMQKTLLLCAMILAGCTTYEKHTLEPLGYSYYFNPALKNLSESEFQYEFSKVKGECKMEAYKLQIPSPSCSTIPAPNCTGLTGFALGLCQGQQPYQKCDYSSVNAAEAAQTEIYENCLTAKGWDTAWKNGAGTNTSGGLFEKIGSTNDGVSDIYLKPDSIIKEGDEFKGIVRNINKYNARKSYQGYWVFNEKENWFKVDNGEKTKIPEGSAAELILNRIEELK